MRLKISHVTEYSYDAPVRYALQRLRLVPANSRMQSVGSWSLRISGAREEVRFTDQFGNDTRLISVEGEPHVISIEAGGEVETYDRSGVLGEHRGFAPLWLFEHKTALTTPGEGVAALAKAAGAGSELDRLHRLMAEIGNRVAYEIGATGPDTTAEQAIAAGKGVCQDHAHVFAAVARVLGFPARYVSGYLMVDGTAEQAASHAWAEAYVPGLGWVAFDASNGISPDERYVRLATGRDYRDAMPVSGILLGQAAGRLRSASWWSSNPPIVASGSDSMTYCVGLKIDRGLVFMSDTRTNAGIDSISTFRKMHVWEEPGERVIVLMSAGNLATTQAVVSLLDERTKAVSERAPTLLETPSMYQTARMVGNTVKEVIANSAPAGQKADSYFNASFILGGQIRGSEPRLFLIYPEGNFIESTEDTPFFQIGETKYGKPIIVRAYHPAMSLAETVKLLIVSFDSTLKSNLSVGLPLDLLFYEKDTLKVGLRRRIGVDDPYYRTVSDGWSNALRAAFQSLPDFPA